MIEGIEVLSASEIYAVSNINIAIGVVFIVVMVLFEIGASAVKELWQRVIMIIATIICFCVSIYCAANTEPTGRYEYKVIINDNVSFNDFYNKYEIINIEGKIYTIKEKE